MKINSIMRFIFLSLLFVAFVSFGACGDDSSDDDGDGDSETLIFDTPTGLAASDGTYSYMTNVTWNIVNGASSYKVYRSDSSEGTFVFLGNSSTATYADTTGDVGTPYWYKVSAVNSGSTETDLSDEDEGYSEGTGLPDPAPPIKTIMVYLDGDNNLEEYAMDDFNEIKNANLTGSDINILVLIDRTPSDYDISEGDWTGTQLWEINSTGETRLDDLGKVYFTDGLSNIGDSDEYDMGDPATLESFIDFCIDQYPGNYALILWNHGGGWRKKSLSTDFGLKDISFPVSVEATNGSAGTKAVCWDETSDDNTLYMDEVQTAVTDKGITVIGFDACLMGMIEVAWELKDLASYMIASEATEPASGWDYTSWLEEFIATSSKNAVDMCNAVVDTYGDFYGIGYGATLSAIDLSRIDNAFSALNNFSLSLYNSITTDARRNAVGNKIIDDAENYWLGVYGTDYNIDLYDLAEVIRTNYNYNDTDCSLLKNAVSSSVVAEWHDPLYSTDSHGLAVHFINVNSSGNPAMWPSYCMGNSDGFPVDFVQNPNNKWVAHYNSGIVGPGFLYRLWWEWLP
jgi:hypothetical protein